MKINKIVIVGAGPVSFALCKSLRVSGYIGEIIAYDCSKNKKGIVNNPVFLKGSPKTRQPEFLNATKQLQEEMQIESEIFNYIPIGGVGGGTRFWGASIAEFADKTLDRCHMDRLKYKKNLQSVIKFMSISGNVDDDLKSKFKITPVSKSLQVTDKVKFFFKKTEDITISWPRLAVDQSRCTLCGNCFDPCKTNAIWNISKEDFLKLNVQIITQTVSFLSKKDKNYLVYDVNKKLLNESKVLVLAANVVSNFNLLCSLSKLKKANLYSTPSYSFLVSVFKKNNLNLFGMANSTFFINSKNKSTLSFGNIYDGISLNVKDRKIFSANKFVDWALKSFLKFTIIGVGFLSSDNVKTQIIKKGARIKILSKSTNIYSQNISYVKNIIKKNVFSIFSLAYFKTNPQGVDIHYAGGVPFGLQVNPDTGAVRSYTGLYLAGGSNFSYLPPESPTLSFMANSYGVGQYISLKHLLK